MAIIAAVTISAIVLSGKLAAALDSAAATAIPAKAFEQFCVCNCGKPIGQFKQKHATPAHKEQQYKTANGENYSKKMQGPRPCKINASDPYPKTGGCVFTRQDRILPRL